MTSDDLLGRTSSYQPPLRSRPRRWDFLSSVIRTLDRAQLGSDYESEFTAAATIGNNTSGFRVSTSYDGDSSSDENDQGVDVGGGDDDEEDDDDDVESDDGPSVAEIERINGERMHALLCPEDFDDAFDDGEELGGDARRRRILNPYLFAEQRGEARIRQQQQQQTGEQHGARVLVPRPPNPTEESNAHPSSPVDNGIIHGGILEPHAHFFIEREKSMVSIKFDPPPYVFDFILAGQKRVSLLIVQKVRKIYLDQIAEPQSWEEH